jgi:hypothetical protein
METLEQVRHTWSQVVERFCADGRPLVRTTTAVEPADLQAAWTTCLSSVQDLFVRHYGLAAVEERFQVPQDYAIFMQAIGGGWRWPYSLEWSLFDAETVAYLTLDNFQLFVLGAEENDEPVLDSGFWLSIGGWSDKHEYMLCCDCIHSHYGVVIDGHDSHPWLNGIEFGGCYRMADSFLEWLGMRGRITKP